MYTPLYFAKIMDLNSQSYNNKWTRAIKQTLLNIDDVLLFICTTLISSIRLMKENSNISMIFYYQAVLKCTK